ncbi:MAG TPA: hypothetical protein VMW50_03500 [Dehalococcoidia bacterium]|nr:hypothetical protein [Dehalococcoidia bacterium]
MKDLTMAQVTAQLSKLTEHPCSLQNSYLQYPWYSKEEMAQINKKQKKGFINFPNDCQISPGFHTWREVLDYFKDLIEKRKTNE